MFQYDKEKVSDLEDGCKLHENIKTLTTYLNMVVGGIVSLMNKFLATIIVYICGLIGFKTVSGRINSMRVFILAIYQF